MNLKIFPITYSFIDFTEVYYHIHVKLRTKKQGNIYEYEAQTMHKQCTNTLHYGIFEIFSK